jgi:hypothetical protein
MGFNGISMELKFDGILWIVFFIFLEFHGTKNWMFFSISQIRMKLFGDLSLENDLPSEINVH